MARKVFISFLGTSNYINCYYRYDDGTKSNPVRFVQEALIEHLCRDWTEKDAILIFCTSKEKTGVDGSHELNWFDNGQPKATTEIERIGLKHRLEDLKKTLPLKADIKEIGIKAGFSEEEIWDIFNTVYDELQLSDQIYFDATHAFRSIPMFSVVLFNYAKFMKSSNLEAIYYGAFEKLGSPQNVSKMPLQDRVAPIINLSDIALLQEYNQIASELKYFGKVKTLSDAISQTSDNSAIIPIERLSEAINKLDDYITTIDLNNLKNGCFVQDFKDNLKFLKKKKVLPKPIENILDELSELMSDFQPNVSFKNIEAAIKWTIKYEMLMQTYPLAEEYIIMRIADSLKKLKPKE